VGGVIALVRGAFATLVRGTDAVFAQRLRQRLYRTTCHIDTGVVITVPAHFSAGAGSALYHAAYVLNTHGRVVLGENSHLGAFCYVNAHYGRVSLGDDVAVGPGTKLIAYSNHYRAGAKVTEERITADVRIGTNVFIGANCTILPGAAIGDNIVIAAGSVVKGELAEEGIYGGAPARLLRGSWYR
jgi:acetyltransferase-like isoleucine patch superfamily enzyme